jgi:activator of HSP90 ATPase
MAKLGDQDSRWIVSSRVDGKNVLNWHWSEKNLSNAMKARLTEMLQGFTITQNNVSIVFTEIEKVDGEMTAMNRKGKTIFVYDFSMKMKWKGEIAPVEAIDEKIEANGTLELIDVMVDDDDYQQKIVVENEDKSKAPIKDTLKKLVNKKVAEILASLVEEARESVGVQQPTGQVQVITEDAPVKIVQGQPVSLASSAKTTSINTNIQSKPSSGLDVKTIKQTITFDVPPQPLYEFLTDERKISAFTQGPCKFSTISPGGAFEMFGGNVVGTQVCLDANKKIEQLWRFNSWPENHFSNLKIEFKEENGSTKLILTQTGVPANDYDRTRGGWEEYFWIRIRGICGWNYKIV